MQPLPCRVCEQWAGQARRGLQALRFRLILLPGVQQLRRELPTGQRLLGARPVCPVQGRRVQLRAKWLHSVRCRNLCGLSRRVRVLTLSGWVGQWPWGNLLPRHMQRRNRGAINQFEGMCTVPHRCC